jgi:hypothetical protein
MATVLAFVKEKHRPEIIEFLVCTVLLPDRGQSNWLKPAEIRKSDCVLTVLFLNKTFRYVYVGPFKMVLTICTETSVTNCQSTLQSEDLQG